MQRRSRAVRELQHRAARARADAGRTADALPEPSQVVDALLALPGVVRAGSTPLSTLYQLLTAVGCKVHRATAEQDREDLEHFGKRTQRRSFQFSPPWKRKDSDEISACVPHDTTDEERLEHFPSFVAQALAVREGYSHVPRSDWHRAVAAELRARLAIESVEQKGAA